MLLSEKKKTFEDIISSHNLPQVRMHVVWKRWAKVNWSQIILLLPHFKLDLFVSTPSVMNSDASD